ncbi:uncharacterized protein [Drosophila takahashii]|uniref:uncharacterized protein n=1 Tax=Drosophila takahashii TaxID=29030 RepID=UPI001CF8A575|nr:uncharacterized protein LOC123002789 [Drosophila takahashii]
MVDDGGREAVAKALSLQIITFQKQKSYEVNFVSLTWEVNSTPLDFSKLRFIGRERLLNGTFELLEDLEQFTFSIDIYSDAARNGDYKLMPLSVPAEKFCEVIEKFGYYLTDGIKYGINTDLFIPKSPCVIPKGVYYLKNGSFNVDRWPPIMFRGNIRHNGKFYRDGKEIGSYNLTSSIEDRSLFF